MAAHHSFECGPRSVRRQKKNARHAGESSAYFVKPKQQLPCFDSVLLLCMVGERQWHMQV